MSTPEAPVLRFAFQVVAEVGAYLPLEHRDRELLEFVPITGGTVVRHLTRSVFVDRAFADEHDTTIDVFDVFA
ncbi:hypothetical protein [Microbacterium sp. LWH3-1.2]|uniref:hypothetical protein n=1 Tax=Microbacterium sp. LWH3-1.2 TaxID=3135256 RepID=UPI003437BB16